MPQLDASVSLGKVMCLSGTRVTRGLGPEQVQHDYYFRPLGQKPQVAEGIGRGGEQSMQPGWAGSPSDSAPQTTASDLVQV